MKNRIALLALLTGSLVSAAEQTPANQPAPAQQPSAPQTVTSQPAPAPQPAQLTPWQLIERNRRGREQLARERAMYGFGYASEGDGGSKHGADR